jgi:microcystin-dependent protein
MAVADAQAYYDPIGGETTGYISPQDAKNAIAQTYTDFATADTNRVAKAGDTMTGALTLPGAPTNANEAATKGYVDQSMPIGAIIAYAGNTAPTGWHLCDGTAHGSGALQTILGSSLAPDLRDRFIVGVGSTYAKADTGGAATVGLVTANMPAHSHGGSVVTANATHSHGGLTGGQDTNHLHSGTTGTMNSNTSHDHAWEGINQNSSSDTYDAGGWDGSTLWRRGGGSYHLYQGVSATDTNHTHNFTTGGDDRTHKHAITSDNASHVHTVNSEGSGTAHENRPPYYALVYIVKKA